MFIGLTGYNHESSAALVDNNGVLIDYCKEEYLSRIKGDKSFPKRSLERIIKINNLDISKIIEITFYERPLSAYITILQTSGKNMPKSLPLISHQCRNFNKSSVACYLDIAKTYPGLEKKLSYCDHHLSHTLTSLAYSPKQNEICSVVVDGFEIGKDRALLEAGIRPNSRIINNVSAAATEVFVDTAVPLFGEIDLLDSRRCCFRPFVAPQVTIRRLASLRRNKNERFSTGA